MKIRSSKIMSAVVSCVVASTLLIPQGFMNAKAIWCAKDGFDKSRYTLTGNMAEDVATIAKSQKGRFCDDFGYSGVDWGAWCDEYVADCLENAGCDSTVVAHGGTVADFANKMRQRGAVQVSTPQTGDLVFFTYSHVEIVTMVENGVVYSAGGNNNDPNTNTYHDGGCCAGEHRASSISYYLRPNYPNIYLSDASIYTDKSMYHVGEQITFHFNVKNAAEVYIPIDYNGKRSDFIDVSGLTDFTCDFEQPGTYGYFLYAKRGDSDISTVDNYKEIYVYDEKPYNLSISNNKTEYELGEDVVFEFEASNAEELYIPIDFNGKRSDFINVGNQTSLTCTFENPGVYGYFLYAKNYYGEASTVSDYVQFTIYDQAPQKLSISNNKNVYKKGETVDFTFTSEYAKELYIPLDYEGKRYDFIDVSGMNSYSIKFDNVGTYGYFLFGRNKFGETSTVEDYKQFIVYDEGDVNLDGECNVSDVVLLQKWLLAVPDTHLACWQAANLCEDDRLDVFDLCLMKRKLING